MIAAAAARGGAAWRRWREPRSLAGRLVLILTAVGIAGALGITLLLASVITPSFSRLERRAVDAHVERAHAALSDYRAEVERAAEDLADRAVPPTDIARWIDDGRHDGPAMRDRLVAATRDVDLAHLLGRRGSASFFVRLGDTVAAVGVARVPRGDGSGGPGRHLLVARAITSAQLAGLLQPGARIDRPSAQGEIVRTTASRITVAVPMAGADGRTVASARFTVRREASVLGRRMLLLAVAGSTVLLLLVLIVLRRVITRLVLQPLERVEDHMEMVRASGSLSLLDEQGRRDEIGSLGRSFNAMLRQLRDLREQLEVQSFALGRSESAVAVMHNVRNALNPISTILSHGSAQTAPVERAVLDRALAELAAGDLPEARRLKLVAFVAAAVEAGAAARVERVRQMAIGREAMRHVLDIIGEQQAHAHERPPLSVCDVSEIVVQNAAIARFSGGAPIAFSCPEGAVPVLANRVILSQVIGNVFSNAAEAIAARGRGSGEIGVTIDAGEVVTVRIRDDGEGFEPAVAATLFGRGYSTRAHKSGGLGLHWCANSMTAMEGELRLESEGRGRGAVAVLTLRAPRTVAEAA